MKLKEYVGRFKKGVDQFKKDSRKKNREMQEGIEKLAMKQGEAAKKMEEGIEEMRKSTEKKNEEMAKGIKEMQKQKKEFFQNW